MSTTCLVMLFRLEFFIQQLIEGLLRAGQIREFYDSTGSIAGLHERPLTGVRFLWLLRSETAGR